MTGRSRLPAELKEDAALRTDTHTFEVESYQKSTQPIEKHFLVVSSVLGDDAV